MAKTGLNEMLDMIVGSLEGYPNHGGDIRVMEQVERIEAAAYERGLMDAADILLHELTLRESLEDHMEPIGKLRDEILALKDRGAK